ncbi:cyclin [Paraphaeosphaeria sporulosa]
MSSQKPTWWTALSVSSPALSPPQRADANSQTQDTATRTVTLLWPSSIQSSHCGGAATSEMIPLRMFIQELLRRSRASYSTLNVSLYYLVLLKIHLSSREDAVPPKSLQCGRRMFLAALILAFKYLHDCNYSTQKWTKISGLGARHINANEMAFLTVIDWKLNITGPIWNRLQEAILQSSTLSWGVCVQINLDSLIPKPVPAHPNQ